MVGSNILLLMIVQLWGVILDFSQEKISTCHSTPPWSRRCNYQVHSMNQFLCDYSNVIWVTSHSRALHLKTISSGFSPCCFSPRTALRAQGQDNLPLRRGSPFWSTAQIQTHVSTTLHTAGRCARTRSHPASRSGSPQYNSISKKNVTFKMGREYV